MSDGLHCIGHIDVDAFYVSVELQRHPELRGLPVVVAGSGPRAVVTTASYEARKFGVGSAIPASRARRLCPQAVFIEPDHAEYGRVSRRLMELVRSQIERVEVVGLDEAYLDLTGLLSPRAAMRRLLHAIRAEVGLQASVGIGPNKLVAKVASDAEKPNGFVCLSREEACVRFAGAPPRLLPGIGEKTAERLEALGITTIAALAGAEPERLGSMFGPNTGPWLVRRGQFYGADELTLERIAVSESRETTFPVDIAGRPEQEAALRRLAKELCAGLKPDRRGRTIAIKVRLADFTTVTRARTVAEPTADASLVASVACALLAEYAPPQPVRLLGVRLASFVDGDEPPAASELEPAGQLALPL